MRNEHNQNTSQNAAAIPELDCLKLPPLLGVWRGEYVNQRNPDHHTIGAPLFDAGVRIAGLTERFHYCSNRYTADFHRVTLLLQGTLAVQMADTVHHLESGELAVCPADTLFQRKTDAGAHFIFFELEDTALWAPLRQQGPYIRPYGSCDLVYVLMRRITGAIRDPAAIPLSQTLSEGGMLMQLLQGELKRVNNADPESARMETLIAAIRATPGYNWTIAAMCNRVHVCRTKLMQLMHAHTGHAPHEFVVMNRMQEAGRLLKTSKKNTIERVARSVGYSSSQSFSRLFSRHMGASPGRYRGE